MRTPTKALLVMLLAPTCVIVLFLEGPPLIGRTFVWWLKREARLVDCSLQIGKCETAGWLAPIVLQNIALSSAETSDKQFDLHIARLSCQLRWWHKLLPQPNESFIRALDIEGFSGTIANNTGRSIRSDAFRRLDGLLPDQFHLRAPSIQIEAYGSTVVIRDAEASGGGTVPGALRFGLLTANSFFLHQELRNTNIFLQWKEHRFTMGTIKLGGGLTIDSSEIDLSHLGSGDVSLTISADVFDGRFRGTCATGVDGTSRRWDIAASASEIPLGSVAAALGLRESISGKVHASKLTFRGDPYRLLDSTSSVWLELTDLRWRNRTADVLMVGASLYGRELNLQQLYVKQRGNEFTLTGETPLRPDWLGTDFRGDVAGSINNIGEFAELFGLPASQFAGRLSIEGSVKTNQRKVSGELAVAGRNLTIFGAPIDSLSSRLLVDQTTIAIDQLDVHLRDDAFTARAAIDLRTSDIGYLNLTTVEGASGFSGHLALQASGLSIDLVPTQPLFVSPGSATTTCFSGFRFIHTASTIELQKMTIDTSYGLRLVTTSSDSLASLTPDPRVIELPFCTVNETADKLQLIPRPAF